MKESTLILDHGAIAQGQCKSSLEAILGDGSRRLLQEALELSETLLPLEKKLKQAKKEGLIQADYFGHQIDEAEKAEIISAKETRELRSYHEKVLHLLSVDDFSPEELCRTGSTGDGPAVPEAASDTVPDVPRSKKLPARKVTRKKPAKKAATKKSGRKKVSSKKKSKKKK